MGWPRRVSRRTELPARLQATLVILSPITILLSMPVRPFSPAGATYVPCPSQWHCHTVFLDSAITDLTSKNGGPSAEVSVTMGLGMTKVASKREDSAVRRDPSRAQTFPAVCRKCAKTLHKDLFLDFTAFAATGTQRHESTGF